jgi:hypothetical protein
VIRVEQRIAEEYVVGVVQRVGGVLEQVDELRIHLEGVLVIQQVRDDHPESSTSTVVQCTTMQVKTAMLADAAVVASGKLYVHGGGWDRLGSVTFPMTHPTMSVVLLLSVEYDEALVNHEMNVVLVLDQTEVGPKRLGTLNVGHPPGMTRGASILVPLVLDFPGLTLEKPGRYEWVVSVDSQILERLIMEAFILQMPQPQLA